MKNKISKTLMACAVAVAMGFSASASAAEYLDFEVNTSIGGIEKTFTADQMIGKYVELINFTRPGFFRRIAILVRW